MSRIIRRKLLGQLRQLISDNESLLRSFTRKNKAELGHGLQQFQDTAIELGQAVDEVCGENTKTVQELENYCECVYRSYQDVQSGICSRTALQRQARSLKRAYELLQADLPDQLEIVFLPYKASMWDSLESIWRAAEMDLECAAYVIPVPYYDKNADGSPGEYHYEGGEFPDDVPVTDYAQYNLEARYPDIIYIHNPYDNCNRVTAVHSSYYARYLKQYTGTLVYVPYFVMDGNVVTENFAIVPGVLYADYIIVCNEYERQEYIRIFREQYPKFQVAEKLLPLGSPKFDRVRRGSGRGALVPEAWQDRIKGRRVIFYNTSINGLLKAPDTYLLKMRTVFAFFDRREDAVLLWRPHPLSESSIRLLRPELYTEYMQIKEAFIKEETGIYDDTPDASVAMAISGAYYGDSSSLVWLYTACGKKALLQNTALLDTVSGVKLHPADVSGEGMERYFILHDGTGIWSYSLDKHRLQILCGKMPNRAMQYKTLVLNEERKELILPPFSSERLAVFDLCSNNIKYLNIQAAAGRDETVKYYKGAVRNQEMFYFVGEKQTALLQYNSRTGQVKTVNHWRRRFYSEYGYDTGIYFHTGELCTVGNSFWVPLAAPNLVMEYDMSADRAHFYKVGEAPMQFATITFDGSDFWLSGDAPELVRWNKEKNRSSSYSLYSAGVQADPSSPWTDMFCSSLLIGNYIYFAPLKSGAIVRMNLAAQEMEKVREIESGQVCLIMRKWNEGELLFVLMNDECNQKRSDFVLDLNHKERKTDIFSADEQNPEGLQQYFQDSGVIEEMNHGYLKYLLESAAGEPEGQKELHQEPVGTKIHKRIKKERKNK